MVTNKNDELFESDNDSDDEVSDYSLKQMNTKTEIVTDSNILV